MKSYVIEIWYYQDNILPTTSIETNPNATKINYIFYANTIRLYWDYTNSGSKIFRIEYNYLINDKITVTAGAAIIANSWNKLIFNVIYTSSNPPTNSIYNYKFEFFSKNRVSTANQMNVGTVSSPTDQSLKYIVWTHLDPDTTMSELSGIYWHSGFYRGLRIWDGNQADPWVISQYDML